MARSDSDRSAGRLHLFIGYARQSRLPAGDGEGRDEKLVPAQLVKLAVRLPLIVIGMVSGGLIGLLIGRAIAGFVGAVFVDMALVSRLLGLNIIAQLRTNVRCFVATGVMIIACVLVDHNVAATTGTASLALKLAGMMTVGVLSYLSATWACWRIAGRPKGPEREAIDIGRSTLRHSGRMFKRLRQAM